MITVPAADGLRTAGIGLAAAIQVVEVDGTAVAAVGTVAVTAEAGAVMEAVEMVAAVIVVDGREERNE